jgi:hypothetical protein
VDVDVEIERSPEPLDDRDGASARLLEAKGARLAPPEAEHGGHTPAQVVIPREPVPQSVRQTQDPLADGDVWDDLIHQMRGTFRHAATTVLDIDVQAHEAVAGATHKRLRRSEGEIGAIAVNPPSTNRALVSHQVGHPGGVVHVRPASRSGANVTRIRQDS